MSEKKISKEEWQEFTNVWVIGGGFDANCHLYQTYIKARIDFQPKFGLDEPIVKLVERKFTYKGYNVSDIEKVMNEAKVWAEVWAEENIFKLGRERFQQQFIEAELGKEYVRETK